MSLKPGDKKGLPARVYRLPAYVFWLLPVAACLWIFWPFLTEGKVVWGTDLQALGWPFNFSARRALAAGEWPLWNPDLFGGMPAIGSSNINLLYPFWLAYTLLGVPVLSLQSYDAILHLCLAAWGMWLFLRSLGAGRWAASMSGLSWGFSGTLVSILYAGHTNNVEAYALIPWIFWAAAKGTGASTPLKKSLGWVCAGVFLGMQVTAIGMQVFAYTILGLAAFVGWRSWAEIPAPLGGPVRSRWTRNLAGLGLAGALAFLLSAPQLFTSLQYIPFSWRKDFSWQTFTAWSFPWKESLQWWVPGWFGWKEPFYRGEWPFCLTSEYFGLLPWALALGALVAGWKRRKGPERFFLGLGAVSFLIACGLAHPLFFRLPVYSGFRSWTRFLCLFTFSTCVLAGLGLDRLTDPDPLQRRRALRAALAALGAMALVSLALFFAAPGQALASRAVLEPKLGADWLKAAGGMRASAAASAALACVFACLLAGGEYLRQKKMALYAWLPLLLILGLLADTHRMHRQFMVFVEPGSVYSLPEYLRGLPDPGRVEPFRVQEIGAASESNQNALYGFETVEGYHGLVIAAHRLLKEAMAPQYLDYLNLMNARYLFSRQPLAVPGLKELGVGGGVHVYDNTLALPQAFLVYRTRVVSSQDEAAGLLKNPAFNTAQETLVLNGPVLSGKTSKEGHVVWKARTPLRFELEVENPRPACLTLSQNWYPGWQAEVDGKEEKIYEADLALQALMLSPGRHKVEFQFTSRLFSWGLILAALAWLGTLAYSAWAFWRPAKYATVLPRAAESRGREA